MSTLICPECGTPFETVLPAAKGKATVASTGCGLRTCPSGGRGGKPTRTTAKGKAIDDKRAERGARKQTNGYVEQRSTGIGALDFLFGFGRPRKGRK